MKNLWKMEIRRVVHNKGTWAVCLIMMVMVWTDGYLFYELSRDSGKYVYPDLFLQGWLPMDYQFVSCHASAICIDSVWSILL